MEWVSGQASVSTHSSNEDERRIRHPTTPADATTPSASSPPPGRLNTTSREGDRASSIRTAIQRIRNDTSLSDIESRRQIQALMISRAALNSTASDSSNPTTSHVMPSLVPYLADSTYAHTTNNGQLQHAPPSESFPTHECQHYQRNCYLVAPCCRRVCECRFCHDDTSPAGHPPMDRFAVQEIICKLCHTRQGAATNTCCNCNVRFGEYHCSVCNLWMSNASKPFHCSQCGLCRSGGADAYRHCTKCNICILKADFEEHACSAEKFAVNCPICHEDIFSSRLPPWDLPLCGHAIHAHCFQKMAVHADFRCPICRRTAALPQLMKTVWEHRKAAIESQPLPPDLQRSVNISCIDCTAKHKGVPWHDLGVQCSSCNSFNTFVEQNGPMETSSSNDNPIFLAASTTHAISSTNNSITYDNDPHALHNMSDMSTPDRDIVLDDMDNDSTDIIHGDQNDSMDEDDGGMAL